MLVDCEYTVIIIVTIVYACAACAAGTIILQYKRTHKRTCKLQYHKQRKEDKEKDWKVSALVLYSGLN